MISVSRYHDISCGHRVVGHEGKCRRLHGHNYRITFTLEAKHKLDALGRVIDFSIIKEILCAWLEDNWDHKFLVYREDPHVQALLNIDQEIVVVHFNPTAEHMANYLLTIVGPRYLEDYPVVLTQVVVEETRKCSAMANLVVRGRTYPENGDPHLNEEDFDEEYRKQLFGD